MIQIVYPSFVSILISIINGNAHLILLGIQTRQVDYFQFQFQNRVLAINNKLKTNNDTSGK